MRTMSPFSILISLGLSLGPIALNGCAFEGDEPLDDEAALDEIEHGGGSNRDPIIFVHGCTPPDANDTQAAGLFQPMMAEALAEGYPSSYLVAFINSGPQCQSNIAFATQLRDLVNQTRWRTGRSKVDIVAHSMGALAARHYIAFLGGSYYVDDLVTIGGANHGGNGGAPGVELQAIFGYPAYEGMQEMFPPYACKGQASGQPTADIQYNLNGCLTATGRTVWKDETPGYVSYRAIYNSLDEIVTPVEASCLNQSRQNDCSSYVNFRVTVPPGPGPCGPPGTTCLGHVAQLWDPVVIDETLDRCSDSN